MLEMQQAMADSRPWTFVSGSYVSIAVDSVAGAGKDRVVCDGWGGLVKPGGLVASWTWNFHDGS